jgi:aquaporin NIP
MADGRLTKKCIAETLGTFALVFTGTGAIVVNHISGGVVSHVGISLTFGLVVMAMIYSVGHVSGAHLNPAVTIAFSISGRMQRTLVLPYIASQIFGAFIASVLLLSIFGNEASLGATLPQGSEWQSFVLETVLTAILMYVILNVSTGPKEVGTMAGIAIGGVIALEALFAGPISGASMNPARSLAPALLSGNLQGLWIYLTAPILGAIIAVPCWLATGESFID